MRVWISGRQMGIQTVFECGRKIMEKKKHKTCKTAKKKLFFLRIVALFFKKSRNSLSAHALSSLESHLSDQRQITEINYKIIVVFGVHTSSRTHGNGIFQPWSNKHTQIEHVCQNFQHVFQYGHSSFRPDLTKSSQHNIRDNNSMDIQPFWISWMGERRVH